MSRNRRDSYTVTFTTYLSWATAGILFLLPFHAFITTWAGSNFGSIDVFRIWKELAITALIPFSLYFVWTDRALRHWFMRSWLPRLISGYMLFYILMGITALMASRTSISALLYSWFANLRFLGFFMLVVVVSSQSNFLWRYWKHIILLPATVVTLFGLMQRTLLPLNFLSHFGYGPETIPAYQTIDNKLGYRRIQSTLRGPNPLGAYLVLIISLATSLVLNKRTKRLIFLIIGAGVALLLSFSRSAYIGAVVALCLLVFLAIKSRRIRQWLVIGAAAIALITGGGVLLLRQNDVVENTLFHTDNLSLSQESSNSGRWRAIEDGFRDVIQEPFGRGPGTAGPQSFRNDHPPRIAENYFLQVGQEVGVIGIALFIAINLMIGRLLWLYRREPLALALLVSLVGLSVVNLLSHAWADDTLGLLWWGLAGILVGKNLKLMNKHSS